ncbi:MAG: hypothetical protein ACRDGS_00105 [Chloroflexota bacterium]
MFFTGPVSSGLPIVEGAEGNPAAALALVLRLLGRGFDFPGYEHSNRLLVGRLPDPLPVAVPLPEGARVVGSQIHGPVTTIVLDADQPPPSKLTGIRRRSPPITRSSCAAPAGTSPETGMGGRRPGAPGPSRTRMASSGAGCCW